MAYLTDAHNDVLQILMHVAKAAVIKSVPIMALTLTVTLAHAGLATDLTAMDTPAMVIDPPCIDVISIQLIIIPLTDINECSKGVDGCAHNCTNTMGSYTCNCFIGYEFDSDGITCRGIILSESITQTLRC